MRVIFAISICILFTAMLRADTTTKPYFIIGSSTQTVENVLGKPKSFQLIQNLPKSAVLKYEHGSVEVDHDVVVKWDHLDMGRIGITAALQRFSRRSSPDDVVASIGMPPTAKRLTSADPSGKGETELWSYPKASLLFKDGELIGWSDFPCSLPLMMRHSAGAHPPQLGGTAADLGSFMRVPAALLPSQHDVSSLWLYKNNAFIVQDEVIHEKATPRLQQYLIANGTSADGLQQLAKWLMRQPYLDYREPVKTDEDLHAAFVKAHDSTLRVQFKESQQSKTINDDYTKELTDITSGKNPTYNLLMQADRTKYLSDLEESNHKSLEEAYQQMLLEAYQKDLATNFVLIPDIVTTTTVANMKSTLEKAGLIVEVLQQKIDVPAGKLYAMFPQSGSYVPLKSSVTLYVTK